MSTTVARPKALLFDLDGTLSDRDASFEAQLRAQYDEFRAELRHIPQEDYIRRVVELDEHGYADRATVYRSFAAGFDLPEILATRLTNHFHRTYGSFSQFFPEAPAALSTLRMGGLKLGVVTNGSSAMQRAKMDAPGVSTLVDAMLVSD
jgi:putative hydrolase of the HAD superfamily